MEQLYQKVEAMNHDYYDLRGQIVSAEQRISALTERLKMRAMRDDLKVVEHLKKTTEQLAREGQTQRRDEHDR